MCRFRCSVCRGRKPWIVSVPTSRIPRFGIGNWVDVSETVKGLWIRCIYPGAPGKNGGSVRGINVEGQGHMPRKKIDKLVEHAKGCPVPRDLLICALTKMALTSLLSQSL